MITVRELSIKDLEAVVDIEQSIFSLPWSKEGFQSGMELEGSLFLVAVIDREILGYIGIYTSFDEGQITNVAVKKSHQNIGIGKALVKESIKWCEIHRIEHFTLEVRKSNAKAIHLYETLGFVKIGSRKGFYEFPTEDGIVMKLNWR